MIYLGPQRPHRHFDGSIDLGVVQLGDAPLVGGGFVRAYFLVRFGSHGNSVQVDGLHVLDVPMQGCAVRLFLIDLRGICADVDTRLWQRRVGRHVCGHGRVCRCWSVRRRRGMRRQLARVGVHIVVAAVSIRVRIDRTRSHVVHFFAILQRVPIRVLVQRIRTIRYLVTVQKPVTICVGHKRIRLVLLFLLVIQPIPIRIRLLGIRAQLCLFHVGQPIPIRIVGCDLRGCRCRTLGIRRGCRCHAHRLRRRRSMHPIHIVVVAKYRSHANKRHQQSQQREHPPRDPRLHQQRASLLERLPHRRHHRHLKGVPLRRPKPRSSFLWTRFQWNHLLPARRQGDLRRFRLDMQGLCRVTGGDRQTRRRVSLVVQSQTRSPARQLLR